MSEGKTTWSKLGERNVSEMIRLADSGNTHAGQRLLDLGARCLRDSQPLPAALAAWLAARLYAVVADPERAGQELRVCNERGKPPYASDNMHKALAHESLQQMAAWAAFHSIRCGEGKTKASRDGDPTAFEIVSEWLAEGGHVTEGGEPFAPKTIQNWYEQRLPHMRAEVERIATFLDE